MWSKGKLQEEVIKLGIELFKVEEKMDALHKILLLEGASSLIEIGMGEKPMHSKRLDLLEKHLGIEIKRIDTDDLYTVNKIK